MTTNLEYDQQSQCFYRGKNAIIELSPADDCQSHAEFCETANELRSSVERAQQLATERDMLAEALRGIFNSYDAPHKYNQSNAVIAARAALAKLYKTANQNGETKMKSSVYKVVGCAGSQRVEEVYSCETINEAKNVARDCNQRVADKCGISLRTFMASAGWEGKCLIGRAGRNGWSLQRFIGGK